MPHFDVILPTIGRVSLATAIESVTQQTHTNLTLWIMCDGWFADIQSLPNNAVSLYIGGPYNDFGAYARNKANQKIDAFSNGEWVAYIDDDDVWLPHHLETIASLIEQNPSANMIRTAGQSFSMKHKSPRSSKLIRKLGPINSTDILTVGMAHTIDLFSATQGWQPCDNHDHLLWKEMLAAGGQSVESDIVTFQFER